MTEVVVDLQQEDLSEYLDIRDFFDADGDPLFNIADQIDEQTLTKIGNTVVKDYEEDLKSREDWDIAYKAGLDLARQLASEKKRDGDTVNNVKYPILATAAIHFAARTYPNIVSANEVVKVRVIGRDKDGLKANRGKRVSTHMSYQVLEQMDGWEDDMDQLLTILSIAGCMFKKTFYDPIEEKNVSRSILPDDFVVNYYAKSLESANALTHRIELTPNEIFERIQGEIFEEFNYKGTASGENKQSEYSEDKPHDFLEQHRWWDLDDDGYKEPYVITVHKDTKTAVRILPRFDLEGVKYKDDEIVKIKPIHFFTRFLFMPSFDGSIYGMGFGILLAPMNEVVNTTINQLLDAGELATRQSGFIGSGINLGSGNIRLKKGEFRQLKYSGDDIRKNIFHLQFKEPSMVLFSLLGMMVEAAERLSSVTDVMRGEQPQGDVPATTTLALIEQGLKVFSAIYRRIHGALKSELKKIRRLNRMYLEDEDYNLVIDEDETYSAEKEYSDKFLDIIPISSTADVSDVQKIIKGKSLMEIRGQGLNDQVINRRYLEALQIPDIDELLEVPPKPPPWEQVESQAKIALESQKLALDERRVKIEEAQVIEKGIKMRAEAIRALADAESKEAGVQLDMYKNETERLRDLLNTYQKFMEGLGGIGQENVRPMAQQQPGYAGNVPNMGAGEAAVA